MSRSLVVVAVLASSACSFQMHAQSTGAGSAAAAPAPAPVAPRKPKHHASHGHEVSVSFHKSGSVSAKFDWQGRSGRLCRSFAPFKFVGTARLAGSAHLNPDGSVSATGNAQASGKVSGGESAGSCQPPRSAVPKPTPPTPVKEHPPAPEPPKKKPTSGVIDKSPTTKPTSGVIDKSPTVPKTSGVIDKSPPQPPAGPTPGELETPIDPPAEAPPNVFGYPTPVNGCFEGQVFPLDTDTQKLPTNYESLSPVSVLYACEWDIAPRSWDQGFPGVAERFEWFAIRYAGAFHISDAGPYTFRISSDDGTKLSIDGKQVIDNDGQHPPKEAKGSVQLAPGDHQMVLEYFQGPRFQINLQLWVTPPGKSEELFTVR